MPLSEEERRRLRELEQELEEDDPALARRLRRHGARDRSGARKVYGLLAVVAGFAVIIAGVATQLTVLGVVGFLLAGTGAYLFIDATLRPKPWAGSDVVPAFWISSSRPR
jgi:Protein of unknown function (DUF3040)